MTKYEAESLKDHIQLMFSPLIFMADHIDKHNMLNYSEGEEPAGVLVGMTQHMINDEIDNMISEEE